MSDYPDGWFHPESCKGCITCIPATGLDILDEPGPAPDKLAPLMSSSNMAFRTPPEFLDVVRRMGPIGLDPCTTSDNPVGARGFYTPEIDGLTMPWHDLGLEIPDGKTRGPGLVFYNPPYGRALKTWNEKAREEAKRGAEIIGLVPSRTDTSWFQILMSADALCFWKGRLTFWDIHPETGLWGPAVTLNKKTGRYQVSPAPFPSVVPYWGPRANEFRSVFQKHGWVVFSRQQPLFP